MKDGFQVDFGLLPRRPRAFFGLADGFDRKTLKRSYNRMIRRFKPEHHPKEFQLIRAAYEALDEELRAGLEEERAAPTGVLAEVGARTAPAEPAYDTMARLADTSPVRTYAELTHLAAKGPRQYFHLAMMADVVEEARPLAHFHWLLEGLRATGGDPGLASLLTLACREDVPIDLVPELMRDLAGVLEGNYFYHVTEPLWTRWIAHTDYSVALDLFEELRAEVGEEGLVGSLAVLLRLVRHGVPSANEVRLEKGLRVLEEFHHWLPEELFFELDLVEALFEYRRHREEFLDGDPLRARIDATIATYATADVDEAEREFLACQVAIVDGGDAVLEAFPARGDDFNFVLTPMLWMAREVEERTDAEPADLDEGMLGHEVRDWMRRIERATDSSSYGRWWNRVNLLVLLFATAILVMPIGAVALLTPNEGVQGAMFVGWTVAFFVWIRRAWYRFRGERLNPWFAERCYRCLWRSEVASFLRRTHVRAEELEQEIRALEDPGITNGPWMTAYMQQDFGLALLSVGIASLG